MTRYVNINFYKKCKQMVGEAVKHGWYNKQ